MTKEILILLIFGTTISLAQIKPVKTLPLNSPVHAAYVDRPGDLYIQFTSGVIQKFDIHGELIKEYKPTDKLTLFDPRDGSRAFTFCKESRWYSYAFFGSLQKTKLKEEFAINPVLACSSGDKNIWILDQADYSLKKVNTSQSIVEVEVLLPESLQGIPIGDITMREYQGFLFLLNRSTGIYIFNATGQLLKEINGEGIPYFNFLGEELYYVHAGNLIYFDLFDAKTRKTEIDPTVKFMLITDVRTYKIFTDRIELIAANR